MNLLKKMSENASVIIFPSVFAQNKKSTLISSIKKMLKISNQRFSKIKKDDNVIVIEANDPVFASSAINLLFGIDRIAIAKPCKNDFDTVVKAITKIGSKLLLKGEKFFVKVEGRSFGFMPKDIEISATSSIIEQTSNQGIKPGSEEKHDRLLYTYLTKSKAYVCIFSDQGNGGIPYNSQKQKIICSIYDELSAISCLETIKQGFDVKIIVCFRKQSELLNLVKMLNQILPRLIRSKFDLEFFKVSINGVGSKDYLFLVESVTNILITVAKKSAIKRISLALSPLIFPIEFIDNEKMKTLKDKVMPEIPLAGLDNNIIESAKRMGLGKYISRIEKLGKMKFRDLIGKKEIDKIVDQALKTKKIITVPAGPNSIHEIIDKLHLNH